MAIVDIELELDATGLPVFTGPAQCGAILQKMMEAHIAEHQLSPDEQQRMMRMWMEFILRSRKRH